MIIFGCKDGLLAQGNTVMLLHLRTKKLEEDLLPSEPKQDHATQSRPTIRSILLTINHNPLPACMPTECMRVFDQRVTTKWLNLCLPSVKHCITPTRLAEMLQIGTDHRVDHSSAPIVRTARSLFVSDRIQAFETISELDHNTPDKQDEIHQLESIRPLSSANAGTDGSSHVHMELHNRGSVRDCKWKPSAAFLKRVGLRSNKTDFGRRDPGTGAKKVLAGSTNHRFLALHRSRRRRWILL